MLLAERGRSQLAQRRRKVNRLLTEGRQAFLRRVSGIERGAECARYEALLSALADGEATAEQLATLRPLQGNPAN